ncbi:hypothetical protein [Janthinobacterium svalbardensis]|uniref:hypothetical protein n=1 Tax=Janthinobacterium svalbardensis TaxID=368607 RepID=UPI002FCDC0C3
MGDTETNEMTAGLVGLAAALNNAVPIVVILGQEAGWSDLNVDPVLKLALEKTGQKKLGWTSLIGRESLDPNFYQWLAERFARRVPSESLTTLADIPASAIFTSSIDPGLPNLFSTNGREPEPVLLGSPMPSELRSLRRPPLFYLFGRAGAGTQELDPPMSRQALSQRRLQHSSSMLLAVRESATALGLIVIDGFGPNGDWLRSEDLLAAISHAPKGGVVWFGADPLLTEDENDSFQSLKDTGIVVREKRSLSEAYAILRAMGEISQPEKWDEPEIISLQGDTTFVVPPRLRLITEATASIVDNSWTGFLPPFSSPLDAAAFQSFHGAGIGARALVEGIRRGYVFRRDFEDDLESKVERALARHHEQSGAVILHGQSGVGKTIAIGRLAIFGRVKARAAVLIATGNRIPQPAEVSPFLEEVGRHASVTLLLVDANGPVQRYDELLSALRSGGHKVVVVGTCYSLGNDNGRFVAAPASLSISEQDKLTELSNRHQRGQSKFDSKTDHALAKFYWSLPESRGGMADGLSREARYVETALRLKEVKPRPKSGVGALAVALVAAGYGESYDRFFASEITEHNLELDSPAAKVIDYVMAVSRLHKAVPINLLLRTIFSGGKDTASVDVETLRDLFDGEDLFRWQRGGKDQSELLVCSRLQIEAELVCNRRLATPSAEAQRIIELIANAYRAGTDNSEEAHFATDIVYALGPDGPARDRYRDSYLEIARCLTMLRQKHGVLNARLMLQESTLRRSYIRSHEISPEEKVGVLAEATMAVNAALAAIDLSGEMRLYAAKRTREYLLTERAATYGFLATDSAQRGENSDLVWSSYVAARDAARLATGRAFGYQPLDISLWVPIRVLRESSQIGELQRAELQADIRATLDIVDPTTLAPDQAILFNKQRIAAAEALKDAELSDTAFAALEAAGSAVGYYLRARMIAPTRPEFGEIASEADVVAASKTSDYMTQNLPKIIQDSRCLQLLISMEWIKATGRWIFRGFRQPLPFDSAAREKLRSLVAELKVCDAEKFSPQYRYIDAVLQWLTGDEESAIKSWRALGRDTEYLEARRVANRNIITDVAGKPIIFSGLVVKAIGPGRWSVRVDGLNRVVDLQESDFDSEIALGRTARNFAISFNYRGPIADAFYSRGH